MKRNKSILRNFIIYAVVALQFAALVGPMPAMIYAQEVPSTETTLVQTTLPATPGTQSPTGAAAHTFTYNSGTGLWENAYYTWNPDNRLTFPKFEPKRSFNAGTNLWEVRQWSYVPAQQSYQHQISYTYAPAPVVVEPTNNATASNTVPGSNNSVAGSNGNVTSTGPNSSNDVKGNGSNGKTSMMSTGPDSLNTFDLNNNGQADIDLSVNITLNNELNSTSTSGDATIIQNTNAGSALSGDASAIANILNLLQSSWGGSMPELYMADIQGDYFGDIMINPSQLNGAAINGCNCNDLTVNASIDATINNDINLLAQTGNATVSQNTNAGDATTGNATALANVINMIKSSITSGKSFLGILNIRGNLNGDILVAQDVIDELLAANIPTTNLSMCDCGDAFKDFTDNQSIANNITTTAKTGSAYVLKNANGGIASSGNAQTNVTVFNVTGRQIVGQNALLVFVNVLGKWVGFLVDAPGGSTAAIYGGNIAENYLSQSGDFDYDVDTNATITNNINLSALTGDAEVSENTYGGNATSGSADASVNVSNIVGSNFSLAGWFGLLFINIMGDWFGSFGINTQYGNPILPAANTGQGSVMDRSTTSSVISPYNNSFGQTRRPSPNNVRIFEAAITENDEIGGAVLGGVTEATPPMGSNQGFGATAISSKIQNAIIGWALMTFGAGIIAYFFRKGTRSIN